MRNNLTRTFLIPEARLPREFGLAETVGTTTRKRAAAVLASARAKLAVCPKKEMGTKVTRLRDVRHGSTEVAVWRVSTEVSDKQTIRFLMGLVREGPAVAQIGFVGGTEHTLSTSAFETLVDRARARLATTSS
jgi:hypothetical protein